MLRFSAIIGVQCWACATVVAQPLIPPGAGLTECRVAWAAATTDTQRLAVAEAIVLEAQRRIATGEVGYSSIERFAASKLAHLGRLDAAVSALRVVANQAESPEEAADVWRMIGQYEASRPSRLGSSEAEAAYREQLRIMVGAGVTPRNVDLYRMGIMGLAALEADAGRTAEAVETRSPLANLASDNGLAAGARELACLQNARDLRAAGRLIEAIGWYELIRSRFPEFGRSEGQVIYIRMEAASCEAPDLASEARRARLMELWSDPELSALPQSVEIGRQIALSLSAAGRQEAALQANMDVYQRFAAREGEWSGQVSDRVMAIVRETLLDVFASGAPLGRRTDAVWAGGEVVRRFPGTAEAALVVERMPCVAGLPGGCGR
jgi:hypothetical protein